MAGHQACHVVRVAPGTPYTPHHGAHSCNLAEHPDHTSNCPACEILGGAADAAPVPAAIGWVGLATRLAVPRAAAPALVHKTSVLARAPPL